MTVFRLPEPGEVITVRTKDGTLVFGKVVSAHPTGAIIVEGANKYIFARVEDIVR